MCGRYSISEAPDVLKLEFQFNTFLNIEPRYNIAPSQLAPVVVKEESGRKLLMKVLLRGPSRKSPSASPKLSLLRTATKQNLPKFTKISSGFRKLFCKTLANVF